MSSHVFFGKHKPKKFPQFKTKQSSNTLIGFRRNFDYCYFFCDQRLSRNLHSVESVAIALGEDKITRSVAKLFKSRAAYSILGLSYESIGLLEVFGGGGVGKGNF